MFEKLITLLKKRPLCLLLLPFFFVLHGYYENFGFIDTEDILLLLLSYGAGAVGIYFLFFIFYRNTVRAALLAVYLLSFLLFYGAFQDFLKMHIHFASRHRFLITVFCLLLLVLFVYFKKTERSFGRLMLFLNILLSLYMIIDLAGICMKAIHPPANKLSTYGYFEASRYSAVRDTEKPDIYFLVFDEYASTLSLKENYGFSNPIDTFLLRKGFSIQSKAFSNYHLTWVSLASILNMSYINGLKNNQDLTSANIGYSLKLIRENEVIKFLSQQGYGIYNFSVFDISGNPSPISQSLLPVKTRLITDNTFLSRMYHDFGPAMPGAGWIKGWKKHSMVEDNRELLKMTKEFSSIKRKQPSFVYGHFLLPHFPFFLDKTGRPRKDEDIAKELKSDFQVPASYLEYLQYTNTEMKSLIDTIQHNTGGKAVILLMGDHGFRENTFKNMVQNYQCLNAVYLPHKNYGLYYDSISSVNQFKVLFNTLFKQTEPLLKDSTVFLLLPHFSGSNN